MYAGIKHKHTYMPKNTASEQQTKRQFNKPQHTFNTKLNYPKLTTKISKINQKKKKKTIPKHALDLITNKYNT